MDIKHIDIDSDEFEDAPRALREYAKALKRELQTVTTDRDAVRKTLTERALTDVLGDKGFKNPKRVEAALLSDKIDPLDKSAVDAWLADNGDDYARTETAGTTSTESTEPSAQSVETPEQQAQREAYERLADVDGQRMAADMSKLQLAMSEITPEMDGEAVKAIYAKHGI